jgi:hypothetical protein
MIHMVNHVSLLEGCKDDAVPLYRDAIANNTYKKAEKRNLKAEILRRITRLRMEKEVRGQWAMLILKPKNRGSHCE